MSVRRKMSPAKASKIIDTVDAVRQVKARRRARRAVAAVVADVGATHEAHAALGPVDRAAYSRWIREWREELDALSDNEKEELLFAVTPFFRGRQMGSDWRAIRDRLMAIRIAMQPIVPAATRRNDYAYGYWPHGSGW